MESADVRRGDVEGPRDTAVSCGLYVCSTSLWAEWSLFAVSLSASWRVGDFDFFTRLACVCV